MFDLAFLTLDVLEWSRERVSAWREGGGQGFADEDALRSAASVAGVEPTPRLARIPAERLPTALEETHEWLRGTLPATLVGLDAAALGRPEGVVLRTRDRSVIAKARFQDYERTLKRKR